MAIDYSAIEAAGGIGKGKPRQLTRGWKKKENADRMQAAFDAVDARDKGISRISGKETLTNTSDDKALRDHCHMRGRNVDPVEKYNPKRIFTATREEHKAYDAHLLEREGEDADLRLIFRWNRRLVPVGQEPFRIASKRRSQNK